MCWQIDGKSDNCSNDTFVITPCCGVLESRQSSNSDYKTILHICFTPKASEVYRADFIVHGVLGEDLLCIRLEGQGTHDGHFEACASI
jgi:hypothetical protein